MAQRTLPSRSLCGYLKGSGIEVLFSSPIISRAAYPGKWLRRFLRSVQLELICLPNVSKNTRIHGKPNMALFKCPDCGKDVSDRAKTCPSCGRAAPDSGKLTDILEPIIKTATLITGGLYVLGLIVASVRLARLGVLNTDFAKPLYVLTGCWVCFPIAASACVVFPYYSVKRDEVWPLHNRAWRFLAAVIASFIIVVGITTFPKQLLGLGDKFTPFTIALIVMLLLCFFVSRSVFENLYHTPIWLTVPIGVCSLMLLYLMFFSLTLYQEIPTQFGGGAVRTFALTVDDAKIRQAITGIPGARSPIIASVLAETSSSYIVPGPNFPLQKIVSSSFVIVPKTAVVLATVFDANVKPENYEHLRQLTQPPDEDEL